MRITVISEWDMSLDMLAEYADYLLERGWPREAIVDLYSKGKGEWIDAERHCKSTITNLDHEVKPSTD